MAPVSEVIVQKSFNFEIPAMFHCARILMASHEAILGHVKYASVRKNVK
jgi:hypothetical protein